MFFRKQSLFVFISLIALILSYFGIDLVIADIKSRAWMLELDQEVVLYGSHLIAIILNILFFFFLKKRLVQKKILLVAVLWLITFFIIYLFLDWLFPGFIIFLTISIICQILAIKFIKKDDNLIKSVDRVR